MEIHLKLSFHLVFLILVLLEGVTRTAWGGPCYEQTRADNYVQTLGIRPETFRDWRDLCNPRNEFVALLKAFDFIFSLELQQTSQPIAAIPGWISSDYLSYFKTNVTSIVRGNERETNAYMTSESGQVVINPSFFSDLNLLRRAATLIHEARHRNIRYAHVVCLRGDFIGKKSCDASFNRGGSFAVEIEFFARVHYLATNVSAADKARARDMALRLLREDFNHAGISF